MKQTIIAVMFLMAGAASAASAQSSEGVGASATPPLGSGVGTSTINGATDAQSAHAGSPASPDSEFFHDAAIGGSAELVDAQSALQQGANSNIKAFAQQMIADHGKSNVEIQRLAMQKGIPLPAAPDSAHERLTSELAKMHGADFDKAYAENEVTAHRDMIKVFDRATRSPDQDVAAFAQKTLPTLHHHLEMAQALSPDNP